MESSSSYSASQSGEDTTLLTSEIDTTCPTTTTEADSLVDEVVNYDETLPEQVSIDNEIDITLQEPHFSESLHESVQETDARPITLGNEEMNNEIPFELDLSSDSMSILGGNGLQ